MDLVAFAGPFVYYIWVDIRSITFTLVSDLITFSILSDIRRWLRLEWMQIAVLLKCGLDFNST